MSENEKAIFCTTSSKKNMCSDMEKHPFFCQPNILTERCVKNENLPCLQKATRVIEQFGLTEVWRTQLGSTGTILQGFDSSWEESISW